MVSTVKRFPAAVVVMNQTKKCEKGKKKIQISENRVWENINAFELRLM
jgi:hypothetical protein